MVWRKQISLIAQSAHDLHKNAKPLSMLCSNKMSAVNFNYFAAKTSKQVFSDGVEKKDESRDLVRKGTWGMEREEKRRRKNEGNK